MASRRVDDILGAPAEGLNDQGIMALAMDRVHLPGRRVKLDPHSPTSGLHVDAIMVEMLPRWITGKGVDSDLDSARFIAGKIASTEGGNA